MTANAIGLRFGPWQTALADVECDALITDAPFSERTHKANANLTRKAKRDPLGYASLTQGDVFEFVRSWSPRTRGWMCIMTDHNLIPWWEAAFAEVGRYFFAPIPIVDVGMTCRMSGDGPSGWTCWMIVARPRTLVKWGTLPGAYIRSDGDERSPRRGGKPLGVMGAIVRDYSRDGDLVCDPFAGGGTTLLAAASAWRRAVGSEIDPEAYEMAKRRCENGYTPDMFGGKL